jgi:hypothetical protein
MKTSTKQTRADRSDELIALGCQIAMIFCPGRALGLRVGKMWHLLLKAERVDLAANRLYTISLADFYEVGRIGLGASSIPFVANPMLAKGAGGV